MSVTPVSELASRWQEHGRIRIGIKTANARAPMKSIDTFRFTSADIEAITQLAEIYGGTVMPWSEPKASPSEQWQVITKADTIRVFVLPGGLSIWYEQWSGAGIVRRCDGETCQVTAGGPEGSEPTETPCICRARSQVVCKPKTRLNVILPEINLGGVWRLETGSWNAAHEMPAMEQLLGQIQASGLLEGVLKVVKKSQVKNGKKRNFVVPQLSLAANALALAAGSGGLASLPAPTFGSLPPATEQNPLLAAASQGTTGLSFDLDDEIVDAELVDESPAPGDASGRGGASVHTPAEETTHDGQAADPGSPRLEGVGSAPSSGMTRRQTRMILTVKQAADVCQLDEEVLRHALARKASGGKLWSSMKLDVDQQSKVIDWATAIADGDITCTLVSRQPPHVAFGPPD
jgi:hypothetical protein